MEKGLPCATVVVNNISSGNQTMIRLVIKKKYENTDIEWFDNKYGRRLVEMQNDALPGKLKGCRELKCPYQPGDILWIREAWYEFVPEHVIDGKKYSYKANADPESERYRQDYIMSGFPYQWKSSTCMPRAAARLFLKVKSVRAERLQDIREEDAIAEGIKTIFKHRPHHDGTVHCAIVVNHIGQFRDLWNSIRAKRGHRWISNPWVWGVEFELISMGREF